MVSLKLILAVVLASLLLANSVSAGAAVCIGWKRMTYGSLALGFHAWNFDGTQSGNYKIITDGFYSIYRDEWYIYPEIIVTPHGQDHIKMLHLTYMNNGFKRAIEYPEPLCTYYHKGLSRGIYFSCHENGDKGYCSKNYKALSKMCSDYLNLGENSVSCKSSKRPSP